MIELVIFDDAVGPGKMWSKGVPVPQEISIGATKEEVDWHQDWNALGDYAKCLNKNAVKMDSYANYSSALDWCCTMSGSGICLFDYQFVRVQVTAVEVNKVKEAASAVSVKHDIREIVKWFNDNRQGLLLATALATNPHANVDIWLMTGTQSGIDQDKRKLSQLASRGINVDKLGNTLSRAQNPEIAIDDLRLVLKRYSQNREKALTDYHSDSWVNNAIAKWIESYRKLKHDFCQHNPIERSPAEYVKLLADMFELHVDNSGFDRDVNGLKALLWLQRQPSEGVDSEKWFHSWGPDGPNPTWKWITKELLTGVLKSTLEADVGIESSELQLPVLPALPFLVSLRVLVQALQHQDNGILESNEKVILQGEKPVYRLSIPLKRDESKSFGLAKAWRRKCEEGGNAITANGVCAALWNTSLAKVNISNSAACDEVEKSLLGLFDGPGRPVVGVAFAPHYILLHWS